MIEAPWVRLVLILLGLILLVTLGAYAAKHWKYSEHAPAFFDAAPEFVMLVLDIVLN
jgi:hypothetical protein